MVPLTGRLDGAKAPSVTACSRGLTQASVISRAEAVLAAARSLLFAEGGATVLGYADALEGSLGIWRGLRADSRSADYLAPGAAFPDLGPQANAVELAVSRAMRDIADDTAALTLIMGQFAEIAPAG